MNAPTNAPFPASPASPASDEVPPTRRGVLRTTLGAGLLGLTGSFLSACTSGPGATKGGRRGSAATPTPDPDLPVLTSALTEERALLAAYAATMAGNPDLRGKLSAYVRRHEQHLAALTALTRRAGGSTASPSPTPGRTASPGPSSTVVPDAGADTVADLLGLEKAATAARRTNVRVVRDPEHARILASIGACESTHVLTLGTETS
ncbi:ferritin-like domain-containing protein [Actinopolymorpha sp. NPDC004070]|uniref:ferritin-like domain-containing protein n=1 Tax=Actinopolymorpha sp. NPDC004070 TaxID=3154548 RepID=UPI0033AEA3E6